MLLRTSQKFVERKVGLQYLGIISNVIKSWLDVDQTSSLARCIDLLNSSHAIKKVSFSQIVQPLNGACIFFSC